MAIVSPFASLCPLNTFELNPDPITIPGSQMQFLIFFTSLGSSSLTTRSITLFILQSVIILQPCLIVVAFNLFMKGKFVKTEIRSSQEESSRNGDGVHAQRTYQHQRNGYTPVYQQTNATPTPIPINKSRVQQGQPIPSDRANNQSRSTSSAAMSEMTQLRERLKNIHHFYKSRIDEQKSRTSQRNQVFLVMVEEMQRSHVQKVEELRKLIEDAEGDKKDVGLVDQRMTDIKGSIDEILKQSSDLKAHNEQLEAEISEKEQVIKEKEQDLNRIKEELMEARNELQGFERLNLRENKRNKQILVMIDKISEGT